MKNFNKQIFITPLVAQVNISFVDIVFVIYVLSCFRKCSTAKTLTESHPVSFPAGLSSKHTHIVSELFVCLREERGGEIQIIKY